MWGSLRLGPRAEPFSTYQRMGCSCAQYRRVESKSKKAATDICGLEATKFIIQSGTHFTEVDSLKDEVLVHNVKPLQDVCKNGDHYLARYYVRIVLGRCSDGKDPTLRIPETNFYIIKGNSCVEVDCLTVKPRDSASSPKESIFTLHQQCRGGNFYLANRAGFYIIRNKDNTYLHVRDMSKEGYDPSCASRHKLHKSFANGLYYFATEDYFYVLKENGTFGLVYHRTKDLRSSDDDVLTVSPSIVKFIQNSLQDEGTMECSYISL